MSTPIAPIERPRPGQGRLNLVAGYFRILSGAAGIVAVGAAVTALLPQLGWHTTPANPWIAAAGAAVMGFPSDRTSVARASSIRRDSRADHPRCDSDACPQRVGGRSPFRRHLRHRHRRLGERVASSGLMRARSRPSRRSDRPTDRHLTTERCRRLAIYCTVRTQPTLLSDSPAVSLG